MKKNVNLHVDVDEDCYGITLNQIWINQVRAWLTSLVKFEDENNDFETDDLSILDEI